MLEQNLCHLSGVRQVRWLSSKERAVKAVKHNYQAIVTHLENTATDAKATADAGSKAKGYHKAITAIKFVRLLHFMLDYLPLLAQLSRAFQEEKLLIMEIPDALEQTLLALNALKLYPGKNTREFLDKFDIQKKMFAEVKLHSSPGRNADDLATNFTDCIVDSTITYLKSRFSVLQEKPLSLLMIFNFQKWPVDHQQLAAYGVSELIELLETYLYPHFSEDERNEIVSQWPALKVYCKVWRTAKPVDVYSMLLQTKPTSLNAMIKLIEFVMAVSPSTASCERAFSKQNVIKTQLRSVMTQESLRHQLMIMTEGPELKDFDPDRSIAHWLDSSLHSRHIQGHKLKVKPNDDDADIDDVFFNHLSAKKTFTCRLMVRKCSHS
ncbi:zinc finger protein 862-like [Ptychodera flava]|uniref:zinc finger protein 862-like n=1 Tax=Ptychodera flava TaxID=63121 RepID=UPI00396AAAC4